MSLTAGAVPVKPGVWRTLTLADGTTVRAEARGSEFGSWWEDQQGQCYVLQNGQYVSIDRETLFSNIEQNVASRRALASQRALASIGAGASRRSLGACTTDGMGQPGKNSWGAMPSNGEWDIPVLMVEFTDVKFKDQHTKELINDYLVKEGFQYSKAPRSCGSIRDYFVAQSQGKFKPNFKLLGKVTVDKPHDYYGANDPKNDSQKDVKCEELPKDAMLAAKAQLGTDFTPFSKPAPDAWRKAGIPLICILYAGEAESNNIDRPDLIWPHQLDVNMTVDGIQLNSYFVGNELIVTKDADGKTDEQLAGVGVFCHELGHALGLPDWYCTDRSYEGDRAFGMWSIMDVGCYEGGAWAPIGYTAYERSFMGWLQIKTVTEKSTLQLNNPLGEVPAIAITSPADEREYFILESRQPSTWYPNYLGQGLMLTRYAYNAEEWMYDRPNNVKDHKRGMIVTADKSVLGNSVSNSNLFGNDVNTISGQRFWSGNELTATISNIKIGDDGSVTFDFDPGTVDPTKYFTKQVPVNRGGQNGGNVTLRFYEDMPSVAYVSAADFQALMLPGTTTTVTKNGEGDYTLKNPFAEAKVNTTTEQFSSDNYMAFTNLMGTIQKGMDNAYLDGAPYVRYKSQELTPASATVTFDFKKYGIDLRGDDKDVYFPLATIADLYSDLYYHIAGYNGDTLVVVTDNGNSDICMMTPQRTETLLSQSTRSADMAEFCYKELCFTVDHFYGMPGRSPLEAAIKKDGLDKALDGIENGADVKKLLKSTTMSEYLFGMNCLNALLNDGGHTALYVDLKAYLKLIPDVQKALNTWMAANSALKDTYPALYTMVAQYANNLLMRPKRDAVAKARQDKGIASVTYYKEGDTAYLLFPQFGSANYAAWKAYYDGGCKGGTPAVDPKFLGDISVVLDAMKQANDDPEVKNLVVDIALNPGGSLDVVMAMTALMGGQSHFYCENVLTGQKQKTYYDVDCNFDGVFDDKDKEVWKNYQLKYGVMTSDFSFSCGNLFPSLMKDMGFPILGEKSGGGACAVQNFITPEGLQFQLSSARARLTDKNWVNIDPGVVPTLPIEVTGSGATFDYSKFYDVPYVSSLLKSATGINIVESLEFRAESGAAWYTLDGRRLNAQPTQKGLYIVNGRKVVIK